MNLPQFNNFVQNQMHEAIYDDSDGRRIVVIRMIDLYYLANKFKEQTSVAIPPKTDTQRSQDTEVQPEQ